MNLPTQTKSFQDWLKEYPEEQDLLNFLDLFFDDESPRKEYEDVLHHRYTEQNKTDLLKWKRWHSNDT